MISEAAKTNLDSFIEVAIPIIIGGILTLINWFFNRKAKVKDDAKKLDVDNFKTNVEQTNKQREFVIVENQNLYNLLKEELELCRVERQKSEEENKIERQRFEEEAKKFHEIIEALQKRLNKVEIELQAWEMGLKTPPGFILLKASEDNDLPEEL